MGKKPIVYVTLLKMCVTCGRWAHKIYYGRFMGCTVTGFPLSAHAPQSREVSYFLLKSFHFRGLQKQ